jgi:hypothetical protein
VQFLVAWFGVSYFMRFMLPVSFYAVSTYFHALLVATAVWLVGFGGAQVLKGASQPTLQGFGAAAVAALVVQGLLNFISSQNLNVLPVWSGAVLVIVAATSGYWSAEDLAELRFDPGLAFILIVSVAGAALGSLAAVVATHAALPPGSYPRALIAVPFLLGGAIGLGLGAGLAHLALYPFRRRNGPS